MKYVQTFEEFTSGIKPKKVSDTHEVAQKEEQEKISAEGPETIEEDAVTEEDKEAQIKSKKTREEMTKVISEFNKEKKQDLGKFYNELLWHIGEPDTKKNVDKLHNYLIDNNFIKYTIADVDVAKLDAFFEGEVSVTGENVNESENINALRVKLNQLYKRKESEKTGKYDKEIKDLSDSINKMKSDK